MLMRLRIHGLQAGENGVFLTRKKDNKPESAVMTFAPDCQSFEVLDFDKKRRITGKRVP